jgi:hypothetical protein
MEEKGAIQAPITWRADSPGASLDDVEKKKQVFPHLRIKPRFLGFLAYNVATMMGCGLKLKHFWRRKFIKNAVFWDDAVWLL